MKTKDIQPGKVYAKREKGKFPYLSTTKWGVPVNTENRYTLGGRYGDILRSGKGILVVVNHVSFFADEQIPEDVAVAQTVAAELSVPSGGTLSDITRPLHSKGVTLDVWSPQDFEGELEEVIAQREHDKNQQREEDKRRTQTQLELEQEFEELQKGLGIEMSAYFKMDEGRVSMSLSNWKKLMGRVEALRQSSPLNDGSL